MTEQRQLDLEDAALYLKRVCALREQEREQAEKVKQLELRLKDERAVLSNIQYQLRSKIDDAGGEDGPLFRHLNQG